MPAVCMGGPRTSCLAPGPQALYRERLPLGLDQAVPAELFGRCVLEHVPQWTPCFAAAQGEELAALENMERWKANVAKCVQHLANARLSFVLQRCFFRSGGTYFW